MITEDYVSFETAKLLKEKGFDEPCYQYYLTTKTLHTTFHNRVWVEQEPFFNSLGLGGLYEVPDKTLFEEICSAPTLQMVMKWLREVHNIEIRVIYDNDKRCWYGACNPMNESQILLGFGRKSKSYEEACEEAIKYCLENLI